MRSHEGLAQHFTTMRTNQYATWHSYISRSTFFKEGKAKQDQFRSDHQQNNMSYIQQYLIIVLLHATSAEGGRDLSLRSNPGLHAFNYYRSFADDISFGKLIVTVSTKQIVKAVQKASATMDQKLNSPSPFLKLMGRRVMESVNPATAKLKTMDAILYQAH